MDLDEEINLFHRKMNTPEIIHETYYRRNHRMYPLVCYINTIIGSYSSQNYRIMHVFILRSFHFIANVNITDENFRSHIYNYLKLIYRYLETCFDDTDKPIVPDFYQKVIDAIEWD